MISVTTDMSRFTIQQTAARIKAQKRANETGLVYLLFVDPRTGEVDFIAEVDKAQIGEATALPGKVWPKVHRSLGDALATRGEVRE